MLLPRHGLIIPSAGVRQPDPLPIPSHQHVASSCPSSHLILLSPAPYSIPPHASPPSLTTSSLQVSPHQILPSDTSLHRLQRTLFPNIYKRGLGVFAIFHVSSDTSQHGLVRISTSGRLPPAARRVPCKTFIILTPHLSISHHNILPQAHSNATELTELLALNSNMYEDRREEKRRECFPCLRHHAAT